MGNTTGKKIKKLFTNKLLFLALLAVAITQPAWVSYQHRETFFSKGYASRYESLHKLYDNSQYVKKVNPGIIPDETFEAFVGGAFLRGVNPIHIVHEHPPLGRYIISLSILLFDNASTIILPLLALSLVAFFLISKTVIKNPLLAMIPVVIFSNEPLFISKLQYSPLLESIQLPFILLSLYFFIKGINVKTGFRWYALASLMVGCVMSIRFFILGATLFCAMVLYFLTKRKFNRQFIYLLISVPLSLIVLFASYTKTILEGYSLWQILGVQKYMFYYHQTKLEHSFTFWDLILFNRWHTWWGARSVVRDSAWFVGWPIAVFFEFSFVVATFLRKIQMNEAEKFLSIWVFVYFGLLSIGDSTTRYFLPLVPILYILTISFLTRFIYPRLFLRKVNKI